MFVTLSGIFMEVRLVQWVKTECSILFTLSGMFMEVRFLQLEKAELPMLVTLSGMIVVEHPTISLLLLVSIMALQPLRESYMVLPSATIMEVRLLQLEKALCPMFVTFLGMIKEVRLLQL